MLKLYLVLGSPQLKLMVCGGGIGGRSPPIKFTILSRKSINPESCWIALRTLRSRYTMSFVIPTAARIYAYVLPIPGPGPISDRRPDWTGPDLSIWIRSDFGRPIRFSKQDSSFATETIPHFQTMRFVISTQNNGSFPRTTAHHSETKPLRIFKQEFSNHLSSYHIRVI